MDLGAQVTSRVREKAPGASGSLSSWEIRANAAAFFLVL